jgi:hypothetical protein
MRSQNGAGRGDRGGDLLDKSKCGLVYRVLNMSDSSSRGRIGDLRSDHWLDGVHSTTGFHECTILSIRRDQALFRQWGSSSWGRLTRRSGGQVARRRTAARLPGVDEGSTRSSSWLQGGGLGRREFVVVLHVV